MPEKCHRTGIAGRDDVKRTPLPTGKGKESVQGPGRRLGRERQAVDMRRAWFCSPSDSAGPPREGNRITHPWNGSTMVSPAQPSPEQATRIEDGV